MISVIMASYLGEYENSASDRKTKFIRAVDSFVNQTYKDAELIIISDGCQDTIDLYKANYLDYSNIRIVAIDKQELFSGKVRDIGIDRASFDWICYLDTDDYFGNNHLEKLVSQIEELPIWAEWVYYDDYFNRRGVVESRVNIVKLGRIGTSSIAPKKAQQHWDSGYNHDWRFIERLGNLHQKINQCEHYVCHMPRVTDE